MSDEKKGRYTEAQAKAAKKYLKESVEDVRIRVPKGQKAVIKAHAEKQGESMNAFVIRAIDETMKRDSSRKLDKEWVRLAAFYQVTLQEILYALYSSIFHVLIYYYEVVIIYGQKMVIWTLYAVTAVYQ